MDATFYITDTPEPAILGLPSCSRLRIVQLNCTVQFRKHGKPITPCPEREKIQQEMKNLNPISTCEDLIKAYPDRFEGIGKFPGTYHIHLKEDAIPVVNAPSKCPIAIRLLVDKKVMGAGSHCSSYRTNRLGIITHLLMEGRWWPQDLPQPNTPQQGYQKRPLQNTDTQGDNTWASW